MATRQHVTPRVHTPYVRRERVTLSSAAYRLQQEHGESARSWEARMTGPDSDFNRVAKMVTVLRRLGLDDAVSERLAPIHVALGPTVPCSLTDAVNRHNASDALEDCAQAEFLKHAGDAELDGWIKKLAGDLTAGERLLAALEAERQRRREEAR